MFTVAGMAARLIGLMSMPKGTTELKLDFGSLLGPLFFSWCAF